MKRLWRDYNLGIVFFALFAVSWVVQTYTGWREFASEQAALGEAATVFGDGGYVWTWSRTTFENWESEFLQLFSMVVLTAFFIFKGSAESKDGQEQLQQTVDRIERRLDELTAHATSEPRPATSNGNGRSGAETIAAIRRADQQRSA